MPDPDDERVRDPRAEPRIREPQAEALNGDMTRNDLVTALQYMRFPNNGTGLIALDRPVRDFLVSALRRR